MQISATTREIVDLKALYEDLETISGAGVNAQASLEALLSVVKSALMQPGGSKAVLLRRAIARYESVVTPIPVDPDLRK